MALVKKANKKILISDRESNSSFQFLFVFNRKNRETLSKIENNQTNRKKKKENFRKFLVTIIDKDPMQLIEDRLGSRLCRAPFQVGKILVRTSLVLVEATWPMLLDGPNSKKFSFQFI